MAHQVETNFMNALPPSLRPAASELYLKENIDELVESRLKSISEVYEKAYSLSDEQWKRVLNAVILTKFSKIHLGSHLTAEHLAQLNYMVKFTLDMQDATIDEVLIFLEENATTFALWYKKLIKTN
ncbi:hypothetical protein [Thiomicrorhabdus sp. Kp2]|uniref:hypothetical protein n=1 Tax=Thiomicrorhabdus sp. Kp2 TaxID=1123518 RepID=UPI0004011DF4|nr:hypothetical protein [Thiomicrorhabdus sp. Kp2]